MAKDARLYAKFTLTFASHPKIAILSDAAFRAIVEMVLWSREQESDGVLARRYATARWSPEVIAELMANDDEKPSLIDHPKGWEIHDYAEIQETKADVEARRERNKAAGQKGGLAKAKRGASKSLSSPVSEPVAEKEEEEEKYISGYVEREGNVSSAGISATPGAELVRQIIPKGHPAATLTSLRLQASELMKTGTDRDVVADALRLWCEKPGVGNGRTILASLCSEVMKIQQGPRPTALRTPAASGHDDKVNDYLAFATNPTARRELTAS